MRPELERLINIDWLEQTLGLNDHVRSILDMSPTPAERKELCSLLQATSDYDFALFLTRLMQLDPRPEYHRVLKKEVVGNDTEMVGYAARALIGGNYPDALEITFSNEKVQEALGDDLAWELSGRGSRLTEAMRQKFLDMFCKRFGNQTPRLDAMTAPWFRMLAELGISNRMVSEILQRIWGELHPRDSHNKFLLLTAMSACPDPGYEPIFKKAKKSKIEDLKDLGNEGLASLKQSLGSERT